MTRTTEVRLMANGLVPTRPFGKTGEQVSSLAFGGWHVGLPPTDEDAAKLIHAAVERGITFMDNAWEYNDGLSERRMGKALKQDGYREKVFLMTKDCAHDRLAKHSMWKLEQSLQRLKTDHLDLWQIHEVVWPDDPERIFAPGGSAESLLKAKEQGKTRYIGFTGHKHPDIFKQMLNKGFPWDACLMPLNVLDAHYASFAQEIIPICQEQGIAILGMKSFADGHLFKSGANVTPQEALNYVLNLPIASLVSGIDSMEVLEQNVAVARDFKPLTEAEVADILSRTAEAAKDGQFEPFKSKGDYEGNEGRAAHGQPFNIPVAVD